MDFTALPKSSKRDPNYRIVTTFGNFSYYYYNITM